MKLSEFDHQFFEVLVDGEFNTLGILESKPENEYLCFAESEKFLKRACKKDDISCIICTPELADVDCLKKSGKGIAVSDFPRTSFYSMHNWLSDNSKEYLPVYNKSSIGNNCVIHPTAVIEDGVVIGDNAVVEEYAIIRKGSIIGDNVIIHTGAVIGGTNYIVSHYEDGRLFMVKQCGNVKVENNIEIGYYSLIACGMFPYETTIVHSNTCIDTGAMVSHNCEIGNNSMVLSYAQVCGSTKIGNNVRINPHGIVSNGLHIEDDVTVSLGAVVVNSVKKGLKVSGNFAIEHNKFLLWHLKKIKERKQSRK